MITKKLLILAGDGIGPEIMTQVQRVICWMAKKRNITFDVNEGLIGGASYDKFGHPLTDETLQDAFDADAVLLGSVGGYKWDNLSFDLRPEQGLLRLRKNLELFANLRPAVVFDALVDASSLKTEIVKGLDIMIVRELTGGIYFGKPRGIEILSTGERRGVNTQVYTTGEIIRIADVAFDLAQKRGNKVHSIEKANVMESGVLWREEVQKLHDTKYSAVELYHMYADNCAMQLVRNPKQFDVIVTDNLFGDILSDCAAMLTGSLGMLPSASLGSLNAKGKRHAVYEPVHGSAPDIANKDIANPIATLLSFSMMLRYSFNMSVEADLLEQSIKNILDADLRTSDIMQLGKIKVSTTMMGESLISEMNKLTS
ncbi:MAG: 3-isopropylmalate dehydrogenase [Rhodospirillaceae bacterium]|jgi:3-isopropylmalate dehydrogenase|nr:3-isopropylmalate dehydrogenase [Rhodospirillaceae bacterium]